MKKTILEGEVIESWKVKATHPHSENLTLQVDMGGTTTCLFTDINLKTTKRRLRNYYNVNLNLPKYIGVKRGQTIKVILED